MTISLCDATIRERVLVTRRTHTTQQTIARLVPLVSHSRDPSNNAMSNISCKLQTTYEKNNSVWNLRRQQQRHRNRKSKARKIIDTWSWFIQSFYVIFVRYCALNSVGAQELAQASSSNVILNSAKKTKKKKSSLSMGRARDFSAVWYTFSLFMILFAFALARLVQK